MSALYMAAVLAVAVFLAACDDAVPNPAPGVTFEIDTGQGGEPPESPVNTETLPPVETALAPDASEEAPGTPEPTPEAPSYAYGEYSITMDVDPVNHIITGVEKIKYTNNTNSTLNDICLRTYLNAFAEDPETPPIFKEDRSGVYIRGTDYGKMDILSVTVNNEEAAFVPNGTSVAVPLPEPIAPTEKAEMKLQFSAYVPNINYNTGAKGKAMWCGNFIPVLSVFDQTNGVWRTDPCYAAGDPYFTKTANYQVAINVPAGYVVAGTGAVAVTERAEGLTYTFTAKLTRDFAFAVNPNYVIDTIDTPSGVEVNLYHETPLGNAGEILELASKSLEYYSGLIGAYPYPCLNIVEAGLAFSGGMEYPAMVFIDTRYLQSGGDYSTIPHEIAHQWFYNIIGSDPINAAWMDEGLAQYVQEGVLYDRAAVAKRMKERWNVLTAQLRDIKPNDLNENVGVYKNFSEYYRVQYVRGMLMFHALERTVGADAFGLLLKEYYNRYSFRIAYPQDFMALAVEISGVDLTEFFDKWINGAVMPGLDEFTNLTP